MNFVDYAPVHLITSATPARVGAEMIRYRPNIVLDTGDSPAFAENDWTGREITIGTVRLKLILPTPRCAVPTLAPGTLPRRPDAVRALPDHNRIPLPGFGPRPCLGACAQVLTSGTISAGNHASITPPPPRHPKEHLIGTGHRIPVMPITRLEMRREARRLAPAAERR